jgi:hypothetical protein
MVPHLTLVSAWHFRTTSKAPAFQSSKP